jgi:hypothetical protein
MSLSAGFNVGEYKGCAQSSGGFHDQEMELISESP